MPVRTPLATRTLVDGCQMLSHLPVTQSTGFHFKVSPEMFPWAFKGGKPPEENCSTGAAGHLGTHPLYLAKAGHDCRCSENPRWQ